MFVECTLYVLLSGRIREMANKSNKQKPLRDVNRGMQDIADVYKKGADAPKIPTDDDRRTEEMKEEEKKDKSKGKEPKITFDDTNEQDSGEKAQDQSQSEQESKSEETAKLQEQLIRKAAELENFRKRTQREKQELIQYGNRDLLLRLLEVVDNFDNAFEAGEKHSSDSKMLEGFKMIRRNMMKIFEEYGVKEIEIEKGSKFDVNLHEAVMAMESDLPEGSIVHVAQKGYMYGDRVLRHAKVVTSKGAEE